RLWEISENLHRAELTVTQRSEQVAEYARLAKQKRDANAAQTLHSQPEGKKQDAERVSASLAPTPQTGSPEAGDRLAARDLGLSRDEVRRSQAIAALAPEVKAVAKELGYDDNQSALLKAAKAETPAQQIEALNEIAKRGSVAAKEGARP